MSLLFILTYGSTHTIILSCRGLPPPSPRLITLKRRWAFFSIFITRNIDEFHGSASTGENANGGVFTFCLATARGVTVHAQSRATGDRHTRNFPNIFDPWVVHVYDMVILGTVFAKVLRTLPDIRSDMVKRFTGPVIILPDQMFNMNTCICIYLHCIYFLICGFDFFKICFEIRPVSVMIQ